MYQRVERAIAVSLGLAAAAWLPACRSRLTVQTKSGGPLTEARGHEERDQAGESEAVGELPAGDLERPASDSAEACAEGDSESQGGTQAPVGTVKHCTEDGEINCIATAEFRAAKLASFKPSDIREGVTIAGVVGSFTEPEAPSPSAPPPTCSTDVATDCLVDDGTSFRAVAASALTPGNIRRGIVLGGVVGSYPSAATPLARYVDDGATVTTAGGDEDDFTAFATQLTSEGTFEFWDSKGVRRTGSGDQDLKASNVKSLVVLENLGITGMLGGSAALDCTDAGQVGCLTTPSFRSTKQFRNTAKAATATVRYDNTSGLSVVGLDVHGDTIDDAYDLGFAPEQPWGPAYVASAAYWRDLTADGACDAFADDCIFEDKITGLMWSEESSHLDFSAVPAASWPCGKGGCTQNNGNIVSAGGNGAYQYNNSMTWWDAIYACDYLNTLGFGGFTQGWRLPTQKEAMLANVHGIRSASGNYYMDPANYAYWTSSTSSLYVNMGWASYISNSGATHTNFAKTSYLRFVCVR